MVLLGEEVFHQVCENTAFRIHWLHLYSHHVSRLGSLPPIHSALLLLQELGGKQPIISTSSAPRQSPLAAHSILCTLS